MRISDWSSDVCSSDLLSEDDVVDALHELSAFVNVERHELVIVLPELFVKFDPLWREWNPAQDGLELAAAMLNDPTFPTGPRQIDERQNLGPRRLNPAIAYLEQRHLVRTLHALATGHYMCADVSKTEDRKSTRLNSSHQCEY